MAERGKLYLFRINTTDFPHPNSVALMILQKIQKQYYSGNAPGERVARYAVYAAI